VGDHQPVAVHAVTQPFIVIPVSLFADIPTHHSAVLVQNAIAGKSAVHWVANINITRHFATLGGPTGERQVHYRRAGSGPPVLLLHQSPLSSLEMLPLLRQLAATHTVIAPDTPGYGVSEPLPDADVTMEMLADNLAALLDVLAIDKTALYGFHTGASMATAFARRYPQRTVVAIADGLLCLNDAERDDFLAHYLDPFVPSWDGAHLAWLWTRLKDQSLFFPWYQRRAEARLSMDGASPAVLAANALDIMRSGDCYRRGYRAAMAYDPLPDVAAITAPYYVICKQADPLRHHLSRLPASVQPQVQVDTAATQAAIAGILQPFYQRPAAPAAPTRLAPRPRHDFITVEQHQLQIMRTGKAAAPPVLVLHAAQSSLRSCTEFATALAQHYAVIAIELPGHGETAALTAAASIEKLAGLYNAALNQLGIAACQFIGMGAGAAIQVEMQRLQPRARSLTLIDAIDLTTEQPLQKALSESYQPIDYDAHGGYLLRAWHQVRDHLLFFPWYERRRVHAVDDTPMLDLELLQRRTLELLLAGGSGIALRRAELHYPWRERLHDIEVPLRFAAPSWQPHSLLTQHLAAQLSAPFVSLPRAVPGWGDALISPADSL
jgi:pimeloyl-ACP methyl ester carboxylesterase